MRKPILLASFALFTTLSAFPMKEIAGEFQPWDANCQILGNNVAFMTEWNGVTFKFFDKDGCVFEGGNRLLGIRHAGAKTQRCLVHV